MKAHNEYPNWICVDCGKQYGKGQNSGDSTYHSGTCGWCGRSGVTVTQPRDYGYPHFRKSKAGKYPVKNIS